MFFHTATRQNFSCWVSYCFSTLSFFLNNCTLTSNFQDAVLFLPVRCYASSALTMAQCPSVFVTSRYVETTRLMELVSGMFDLLIHVIELFSTPIYIWQVLGKSIMVPFLDLCVYDTCCRYILTGNGTTYEYSTFLALPFCYVVNMYL